MSVYLVCGFYNLFLFWYLCIQLRLEMRLMILLVNCEHRGCIFSFPRPPYPLKHRGGCRLLAPMGEISNGLELAHWFFCPFVPQCLCGRSSAPAGSGIRVEVSFIWMRQGCLAVQVLFTSKATTQRIFWPDWMTPRGMCAQH